ncbi:MAG TPA: hypothetical protein VFP12_08675 [Allosphingosinicella sp.]|nr:hypothetical protein [Allosphingosinicella sp.]
MNGHISGQADKRVPVALSVLAAVLLLLGAHQMDLPGASPAADQPVQIATTIVSSPAH